MADVTSSLRWYLGLLLVFFAFMPVLSLTLVGVGDTAGDNALVPVLVGGPVNVLGLAFTARGMLAKDPKASTRNLWVGAALIAVGDGLLFGLRAVLS